MNAKSGLVVTTGQNATPRLGMQSFNLRKLTVGALFVFAANGTGDRWMDGCYVRNTRTGQQPLPDDDLSSCLPVR